MCAQCKVRLCLSVLVLFITFVIVRGFNVDTENYVKHSGEPGSMFGFSVAEHKDRGSNWLLVGAPEAQTPQPGVHRGGAVYRCDLSSDDLCDQIQFDRTGNNNNSERQIDSKSYQWFGATVRSSGENGVVVACAPRYVWYSTLLNTNRRDPVGTCFVAKNQMRDFSEFSPCRTRNWGYHRQGSCQAGLGASISKDGNRLFVGAVGSWYWQGQVHSCDSYARLPRPLPPRFDYVNEAGQIVSQNLYDRPDVLSSSEGPPTDDDSYLGYSVTAGDFGGGTGQNDVAVGMPRGAGLLGKIVLYTWNLTNLQNITGEQMGAYFGYSLASVDMDGDKLDDLIIGAPLYTDFSNNEGDYETGRVYVVYQGAGAGKFTSMNSRDGSNSKARFGLALASLGDINKDGYGDVAIGAPYDGPQERGFVYIYHGSATGIREKPSQIIRPDDIGLPLTTFGFSLSGGVDMDENQYPDLIVGAYESDTAVFLKARPVVKMMASINFLSDQKQVVLEEQNCTLKDGTRVACLSLKMCLEYSGLGVDPRLDFDVQLILDSKKQKSPRMALLSVEGQSFQNQTLTLDKGLQRCQEVFVYIKPNIRDKLTTLETEMRYSLRGGATQWSTARRRYQRGLTPVLDLNEPLSHKDSISIQKNCGKDNVCIPNLRINATPNVKRYLLGSGERLFVDVVIMNEGEDAFESVFDMKVPPGINYVNIERVDGDRDVLVQCSAPSFVNNNTLHCDIGNPLPKEKTVHFKVILQPFHKPGMKARYEFEIAVNSTNPENKTSSDDNVQNLVVPVWVETDLILQGSSHPAMVHYNTSLYSEEGNLSHESEIGPQVVHIYSIRNKGPSDIQEAEVHFLWPTSTLAHDNLLYLLEQPETHGPIKCELAPNVNPLKLTLDRKRKSYLELGGIQDALISSTSFSSSLSSSEDGASIEKSGSSSTYSSGSSLSSSSSSRTSSSSSTGSSKSRGKGVSTTILTQEERRRLEEAEKVDREEAAAETGDGSQRHRQRVQTSGTGHAESGSRQISGSTSTGYTSGTYTERGGSGGGGGIRIESGTYGGRGSEGTLITERGRVEVSGARVNSGGGNFETYNSFDNDRRSGESFRVSQSGRTGGSKIEPGVGVGVSRGRFGSDERVYSTDQNSGSAGTQYGGNRGGESTSRRNQTYWYEGSAGGSIPLNVSNIQNRTFTHEEERSSNTTWNSERGGKPITHTSSSWRDNDNGVVHSGSSSSSHEAANVNSHNFNGLGTHSSDRSRSESGGGYTTESSVSRQYASESEKRYRTESVSGSGFRGSGSYTGESENDRNLGSFGSASRQDSRRYDSSSRGGSSGSTLEYDSRRAYDERGSGAAVSSSGYDSRKTQDASSLAGSQGSSASRTYNGAPSSSGSLGSTSSSSSSGSTGYESRRGYGLSGSSGSSSGSDYGLRTHNSNSGSGSSQFDALAGIAQGPRDGVARVYSFDVNSDSNRRTSGGASQYDSIAGMAAGSRAHNVNVEGSSFHGGSGDQYANSSSSSHRNSWSSTSGGGKHYVSGAVNSEERDNVDYDSARDKARRLPVGSDNVDYENADRRGGSSWSASSSWEAKSNNYRGYPEQSSRKARTQTSQSAAGDNVVEVEEPGLQQKFQLYQRYKRQLEDDDSLEDIDCGPIECTRIRCTIGFLTKNEEAWVAFRSRLWAQTLKKFAYHPEVQLSSLVAGRVTKLPHIGAPDQSTIHTHEVVTQVVPRGASGKPDVVPLWVVVLSACAGALILMLLVYLLYKCGFFKRNRPSSNVPEKQPLNRNGHYQSGDEAL